MIPIARAGGISSALRQRILPQHFRKAGLPVPAFFACVNEPDARAGMLVDSISGARASLVGTAAFTRGNRSYLDSPAPIGHGLTLLDFGSAGGANFGAVPALSGLPTSHMIVLAIFSNRNMQVAVPGGDPNVRRASLLAREFRDPSLAHTSMSGWQIAVKQYKNAGATAYGPPCLQVRDAVSASDWFAAPADSAEPLYWNSTNYGGYAIISGNGLRQAVCALGLNTPSSYVAGNMGHANYLQGVANFTNGGTTTSGLLHDNGTGDLTLGYMKDVQTSSYQTDYLNGELLMVGVWTGRSVYDSKLKTSSPYRPGVLNSPRTVLERLGEASVSTSVYIRRDTETRYVSSQVNAAVPAMVDGAAITEGMVRRRASDGRLYKAMNGGVIAPGGVSAFTTENMTAPMTSTTDLIYWTPVSGLSEETPAKDTRSMLPVSGGDEINFMTSHQTNAASEVASYNKAERLRRFHPVKVRFAKGSWHPGTDLSVSFVGPVHIVGDPAYTSVAIKTGYGRTILSSFRVRGGTLSVSNDAAPICAFESRFRPERLWDTYATGAGDGRGYQRPTLYNGDLAYRSHMVNAQRTTGSVFASYVLDMFGGEVVGSIGDISCYTGGQVHRSFGVKPIDRRRLAEGGYDVAALTGRHFMYAGQFMQGMVSHYYKIGGVAGRPYFISSGDQDGHAAVKQHIDSLRAASAILGSPSRSVSSDAEYAGSVSTTVYRKASPARLGPSPFSFKVAPHASAVPAHATAPARLSFHSTGTGSSVRLRMAADASVGSLDYATLTLAYTHATTKKRVVVRYDEATLALTSESSSLWAGSPAAAMYLDIPAASLGVGPVVLEIRTLHTTATFYLDHDIKAV